MIAVLPYVIHPKTAVLGRAGGGIQAIPEARPRTHRQLREPLPSLAEHVDVQGSGQEHYPLQSHSQDRV